MVSSSKKDLEPKWPHFPVMRSSAHVILMWFYHFFRGANEKDGAISCFPSHVFTGNSYSSSFIEPLECSQLDGFRQELDGKWYIKLSPPKGNA